MGNEPRLSHQTVKVLAAFMSRPRGELSGAEIAKQTGLRSGTLYPILVRLEEAGWLDSRWEGEDPTVLGRPRRRYYRVTALGVKTVTAIARDLTPVMGKLAWA
jgi:PadR family transcriptional regulator, regulatory protein PadR